jgi:hypothetical protein
MKRNNVSQKIRNLIEEMETGQIYQPLEDLMKKGKASVEITIDEVRAYWNTTKKPPRKRKPKTRKRGDKNLTKSST